MQQVSISVLNTPRNKKKITEELKHLDIAHPEVQQLRILVHGPVGAGKSSFISSIASVFRGRMVQAALVESSIGGSGHSFSTKFKSTKFKDKDRNVLPFVISDIMGLEDAEVAGVRTDDLVMALEGHLKDGYLFNPAGSVQKENTFYNSCPTLNDKVHCLVSVVPGDKIGLLNDGQVHTVIQKLREIRKKATALTIPQVIVMTMVDKACPEVNKDLKMIYRSKKIKEQMLECQNKLGVPMNFIYPVKNYHEEAELCDDVDILLLYALKNILNFANDHSPYRNVLILFLKKTRMKKTSSYLQEIVNTSDTTVRLVVVLADSCAQNKLDKIPQVVVMTMVDKACPEVKKDLKMIYSSEKIKDKMQECSNKLGVPMNYVYPVKNYHEETELRDDIDVLLLSALKPILTFANDHVDSPTSQRPNFNLPKRLSSFKI
ncbi:interferon-induced protein 44-like [Engraulis encrasicolus]|uniref:interferon-induced protein 44-like n=1 Tax=Engraulis encrasicolus TaxID=184585 RepID=UPI002FD28A74